MLAAVVETEISLKVYAVVKRTERCVNWLVLEAVLLQKPGALRELNYSAENELIWVSTLHCSNVDITLVAFIYYRTEVSEGKLMSL